MSRTLVQDIGVCVSSLKFSNVVYSVPAGVILILGTGRIVGAPSDWFKRSRDCDVGDPSFRTVFQTSQAPSLIYTRCVPK